MDALKKWLNRVFIDGLSGMALGLFCTLIIGTIVQQISENLLSGRIAELVVVISKVAASLTGAGIGVGVAYKLKESPLVVISSAAAGMVGAFASNILKGTVFVDGAIHFVGPGEPMSAFLAAYIAIEVGHLVSGKTKVDIIVTPFLSILSGSTIGLLVGPGMAKFMEALGALINWGTEQQPFFMGIIVSVIMGIVLTLPISSAALGLILKLSGVAAGAATVGCCAHMIGFAVISYRENKVGGLLAQGLGTSMLQVPNLMKKPILWVPAVITSAILGPISTLVFGMTNNAQGSGMGTSGLVGQITTYQTMIASEDAVTVLIKIVILHFILPAILSLIISEFMRKKGIIKDGDLKLSI